jgi:hypothetical protein
MEWFDLICPSVLGLPTPIYPSLGMFWLSHDFEVVFPSMKPWMDFSPDFSTFEGMSLANCLWRDLPNLDVVVPDWLNLEVACSTELSDAFPPGEINLRGWPLLIGVLRKFSSFGWQKLLKSCSLWKHSWCQCSFTSKTIYANVMFMSVLEIQVCPLKRWHRVNGSLVTKVILILSKTNRSQFRYKLQCNMLSK